MKKKKFNKNKFIKMYLSGVKKGTICKKYYLNLKTLDNWILEYQNIQAVNLYFENKNINDICKLLKIDINTLNKRFKEVGIKEQYIQNSNLQKGYNPWINKIT
jgi:sugar diacid utilization regulator